MDSQELRNLSEAYLEVYQVDEGKKQFPTDKVRTKAAEHEKNYLTRPNSYSGQQSKLRANKMKAIASTVNAGADPRKTMHGQDLRKLGKPEFKEEVDLYDVILSHLLDEGYAETIEGAEVIMVNMSEEWRDSIVDEMLDEANRGDEHVTSSMYMSREPETTAAKVRRRQKRDGLPDNPSHKGDDKDYDRQFAHRVERGRKKLKPYSSQTLEGEKNPTGKYAAMQRRKRQGLSY